MFGRDEKVSSVRLTAVQYIILVVFLFLAYGLWRLRAMAAASGTERVLFRGSGKEHDS